MVMNNPFRRFIQKNLEFKIFKHFLKKHNISLTGKTILDAGCGSGYSSEIVSKEFTPAQLIAFDLMPQHIKMAKKRGLEANFFVGDVTKIDLPSNTFDAVFIFGILHHVPEWRKALREIARVLKSEGVLLVEEVNREGVDFVNHLGFYHPGEARFDWSEFAEGIRLSGFEILEEKKILIDEFRSFICLKH
jgi:ubiquinone/menaquinone biosynthesis C-methylase UbiE